MSQRTNRDRANFLVNVAILGTLAVVLLGPSGAIGSRAVGALDTWKTGRTLARIWPTLSDAPSRLGVADGQSNATIVEFIDYECPSCRRVAADVSTVVSSGKVDLVVRHLPLSAIHPSARQAALAAVCAENHGLFAEAHTSLLDNGDWAETTDWLGWARSVGIEDTESFESCLLDESTSNRVDEDIRLAGQVGVTGTPTFVTQKGVFPGELGLTAAVGSIQGYSAGMGQDTVPLVVDLSVPLFVSGEHPDTDVSVLGRLSRAAFVNDRRLVLLDGQRLLFVDFASGDLWIAGGRGDGPGEFRGSAAALELFHNQDQMTVWDVNSRRLSVFADTGELVDTKRLATSIEDFEDRGALFTTAGMFSNRNLAFLDGPGLSFFEDQGIPEIRPRLAVVEVDAEGHHRKIVAFSRDEVSGVLFRHRTYVAVSNDRVIVADTETDAIEVYDRDGQPLWSIPMPGERRPVRKTDLDAASAEARARADRSTERMARLLRAAGRSAEGLEDSGPDPRYNRLSPPIDALLADGQGRLWIRSYIMPDDSVQRWSVWDGSREILNLQLAIDLDLLDARGDLLLLRTEDELGVHQAVIRRMILPQS